MDHGTDTRNLEKSAIDGPSPSAAIASSTPVETLTSAEARVLESLQTSGSALTRRQLEAQTGMSGEQLDTAVQGLREKRLVAKLNTVIPSYSFRYPGIEV